jgi:ankyrin repeat protein
MFAAGKSALHVAAETGNVKHLRRICNAFTYPHELYYSHYILHVDSEDFDGLTPLKCALANGTLEVAEALIVEFGARVNQDVLDFAQKHGGQDIVIKVKAFSEARKLQ